MAYDNYSNDNEEIDSEQEEMDEAEIKLKMQETAQIFAVGLEKKAENNAWLRETIEDRMVDAVTQFNGKYDQATLTKLGSQKGSKAFVNITRQKTNAAISSFSDMLFPTDDRNFSVQPTPVPETAEDDQIVGRDENQNPVTRRELAVRSAEKKAELMQDEIDDQLNEAKYNSQGRECIRQGCLVGTGILKGPVIVGRAKKSWKKITDQETGKTAHQINMVEDKTATVKSVNPFYWYPDMTASTVENSEFFFELHYYTKKQLRKLMKNPGFFKEVIADVLREGIPQDTPPLHLTEIRELAGLESVNADSKYRIWEYTGPIDRDDLIACGCEEDELEDELDSYEGNIWVVAGKVIKANINPMDTEEQPYSVWNLEEDEAGIFGYGVPDLLRSPQKIVNATWRMMLDNAALSVGPQIVVNDKIIEPVAVDGEISWTIESRKVWRLKDATQKVRDAFGAFHININLTQLKELFVMARQLADEESGLPALAQGEKGNAGQQTGREVELLMNSASVVKRRGVKMYDDNVTSPLITRFYDWNMQFNPKEEIKGDYMVDARGSSSLLVKETQARNMLQLMQFAFSPALAPFTKLKETYEKLVTSLQLNTDEIIKSDDEIKKEQELAAQNKQTDPDTQYKMAKLAQDGEHFDITTRLDMATFKQTIQKDYYKIEADMAADGLNDSEKLVLENKKLNLDIVKEMGAEAERMLGRREMSYKETTGKPGM